MRKPPRHAAGIVALVVGRADPKFLQDFLVLKFALSRRAAKAMIDGRNVWVNRRCIWIARHALATGDSVEVPSAVAKAAQKQSSPAVSAAFAWPPADRHVRVLWQNDRYLVCDKPAGLLSCGAAKSAESILRAQESLPTLEAVHRLDRDTTGCLLFAKNHAACEGAIAAFKEHKVSKTYHAIVAGAFRFAHQIVDTPLDGQAAVSKIAREASSGDASLLRIHLETGRTNQIRRHLASIRFPIVGDRVFGLKNARDRRLMSVPRQMLHASTLVLDDPLAPGEEIRVHSPLPADFRSALGLFGMGRRTPRARISSPTRKRK